MSYNRCPMWISWCTILWTEDKKSHYGTVAAAAHEWPSSRPSVRYQRHCKQAEKRQRHPISGLFKTDVLTCKTGWPPVVTNAAADAASASYNSSFCNDCCTRPCGTSETFGAEIPNGRGRSSGNCCLEFCVMDGSATGAATAATAAAAIHAYCV